jgi:hypothetical protein
MTAMAMLKAVEMATSPAAEERGAFLDAAGRQKTGPKLVK